MELIGRLAFVEALRRARQTKPRFLFEERELRVEIARRVLEDECAFVAAASFTRTRIWKRLRYDILEAKTYRCGACGSRGKGQDGLKVDHKRNRRDYPQLALLFGNLQLLCGDCNQGKGNRDNTDWEQRRAAPDADAYIPSNEVIAKLPSLAPGKDPEALLSKYRRFCHRRAKEPIRNADKAFLGWVRKRARRSS